ncbi:MAG: hypothetical protein E7648_02495 [Ruminococcaceae bacterium]|nr:hypothetical protein [Oscillospiraceae bacterium]
MKNFKKILLMGVSYVLIAALAIGGTLAYLKDEDSAVNVMTLGNVSIEQHEYERATNADGTYKTATIDGVTSYVLKPFTQGKALLPIVGDPHLPGDNPGHAGFDSTVVRMTQVDSYGSMQVFAGKNAQDKFVTVENTGKTDAYVRTIIAMEIGSLTEARFDEVISTSSFMTAEGVWKVTDIGIVEIGGNNYYIIEYVYNGAKALGGVHENGVLPAGDTTYPSLAQVYMTAAATNEDVENIDGNKNGTYEILVFSQAVQAAGFDNAETALNAAFGDITTTNHPWSVNPAPAPKLVKTAAELQKALDDAVVGDNTIILGANIEGNVTITQKNGVKIFLDGADKTFNGVMTVFGNGRKATAGLTIKNVNFVAANGAESCIVSPDRKINNAYSYSSNVTVEGCTFTDPDGVVNCAAVRHQDGGDSNWKIIDCVVDNTMHSLVQVNNVELDGLYIEGCEVYSKNGINLNQCTKVTIVDCTIDVKGYAVRYGVNGATVNGTFAIKDSTLKSANDDGDAVIIFRGTMTGSTLTITNTTLTGTPEITGNANVVR